MRKINPDWTDPEIEKDGEYYYVSDAFPMFCCGAFGAVVVCVVFWVIINWR